VAAIVGALGVPHTPFFPALVEREGPQCETARFFAAVTAELEAMRPDLIVMYDTDHLNTFFLDNLPVFAVGVTEAFKGPNDEPRAVPIYTIKSRPDIAAHLRRSAIESGFDLALAQEFTVDHSVVVPLHFMTPTMRVPVIPIFVSGHVPPLPSAKRCYDLGVAIKRAIESWPEGLRVVVIGSGSFSLEVFGPRIAPGKSDGVPDPDWAKRVCTLLEQGAIPTLLNEATQDQMLRAGNVGGELLDWIAMLGAVGEKRPKFVTPQMEQGHAYAAWHGS
jgi:aromatic ring-opening dioxygenase catalytic subunit (LigB family)